MPFIVRCQTLEKDYLKEIRKNCDNPDIVEIERKKDYIEIEYLCDGKLFELVIDRKSDAMVTESETDMSKITTGILKKLNKSYPDWTVDEFTKVTLNDTTLYKVEMVKDGIEQNVYFTLTGKIFKASNFLASDKWNSDVLKDNDIYNSSSYDFFNPLKAIDLPEILNEVSGISIKDQGMVYCIQDEIGSVFFYNMDKETIEGIYRFSEIGDFEDITFHDKTAYILRSDGAIFTVNLEDYSKNTNMQYLPIQSLNFEGISYDAMNESFLIACHDKNISDTINNKNIFRYYPKKNSDNIYKELSISVDNVNEFFKKHYSAIKVSTISFSPSAIALHPLTGDYYILSATDRMIIIYDSKKNFKTIYALPSNIFYKPEGIGFYPNGDLLISNEGTKNGFIKPNLLLFKYD